MNLPKTKDDAPSVPVSFDGEIYKSVGKYARSAVLFAFEQMGGAKGLAEWGEKNEDEFYTKLFPKIIARESEVTHHKTVDQLMDIIDGDYVVEGEFDEAEVVVPNTTERIQPVAPNWNDTSFDDEAQIVEMVSDTDESVSAQDLMDFED